MYNIHQLIEDIKNGKSFEYLFFFKTSQEYGVFSQWWAKHPFIIDNITYQTAEHYMMAEKARMFGDKLIENKIFATNDSFKVKKLGRQVKNFNKYTWMNYAFDIVVNGNLAKFDQHLGLKRKLLNTDNKVLVEASPYDNTWGIKMDYKHPDVENPEKWNGLNLLGFALMKVRDILKEMEK